MTKQAKAVQMFLSIYTQQHSRNFFNHQTSFSILEDFTNQS